MVPVIYDRWQKTDFTECTGAWAKYRYKTTLTVVAATSPSENSMDHLDSVVKDSPTLLSTKAIPITMIATIAKRIPKTHEIIIPMPAAEPLLSCSGSMGYRVATV